MWKVKLNLNAKELRKSGLLVKYIIKILFGWDNKRFKDEYLKNLERNQTRQKKEKSD